MLLKDVAITVFNLDNNSFEPLGEINQYTSLIWPDKFNGFTTFELCAPITEENKALIKKDNVLWCGGDNAAIIEIINSDKNDEGEKVYKVKGRTLEMILTTRIIWGTYDCYNKHTSTAMYEIVDRQCVNPSQAKRKIPFLECAQDELLGKQITFQKTGGEVYDSLQRLASEADLGFNVLFRPREKKLIFKVLAGVDRSIMPTAEGGSNPVIFSTDLEDILSSSYYTNSQDVKSVALVMGEGDGVSRKKVTAGDDSSSGFLRRETYVDARDLQSQVLNEDGSTTNLSDAEYNAALVNRGDGKLAECTVTETFEAQMRVTGGQYVYGIDYNKGDKVLIQDHDLGVQVAGKITEVIENYGNEYELVLVFGYSYPTLIQKLKRQIS